MKPALIVHGGAGRWSDSLDEGKHAALIAALKVGWAILQGGGSALDAVEKAVNVLEDEPLFDAGTGSHLNADGVVEMDALIIDGNARDFGAVAGVQRVRYPITLARHVLADTAQCFFVGAGADALAGRFGVPQVPNMTLVTDHERDAFLKQHLAGVSDTVGAVAVDSQRRVAAATSTGGTRFKPAGRVGDSPVFGAGGYADPVAGASATGVGEQSLRLLLSRGAVDALHAGQTPQQAADSMMAQAHVRFSDPQLGIILLNADGQLGAAHTTDKMATGWVDAAGDFRASVRGGLRQLTSNE